MNKQTVRRKAVALAVVLLAFFMIGAALIILAQNYAVKADYETESVKFVNNVAGSMEEREKNLTTLDQYNRDVSADLIYNITFIYDGTDFPHLNWKERERLDPANVCDMDSFDLESLHIIGDDGTIWLSSDSSLLKKNIVDEGILTQADLDFFNEDNYGTYKLRYREDGTAYTSNEPVYSISDGRKLRYCAIRVIGADEGVYYAVGADTNDMEDDIISAYSDLGVYFDTIVDYDGFSAFAINTDTGIIEYTSPTDSALKGMFAGDAGIENVQSYDDGQFHTLNINGNIRRIFAKYDDAGMVGRYVIVAADIDAQGVQRNTVVMCIILMIVIITLLIRAGFKLATTGRKHIIKEYIACVLACVILGGLVSTYLSSIASMSQAMEQCEVNADTYSTYYRAGQKNYENMSEFYKNKKVAVLKSIAIYLQQNQSTLMNGEDKEVYEYYTKDEDGTKEYIKDVSGNVTESIANNTHLKYVALDEGYNELYIINSMGNTIMTSCDNWYFTINDGKSGHDEEFNAVLERKSKNFYNYKVNEGNVTEMVAVPYDLYVSSDGQGHTVYHDYEEYRKDTTGNIKNEYGLLVAITAAKSDLRLTMESLPMEILSSMKAAEGVELAVTEKTEEGHAFSIYTDGIREEDLAEMEIPESFYLSDNYKILNLNNIDRMLGIGCLDGIKEKNIITVLDNADVQSRRWPIVIAVSAAILLAGIVLIIYFTRFYKKKLEDEKNDESESYDAVPWYKTNVNMITWESAVIIALLVIYMIAFTDANMRLIKYVLTVKWEKGIHIFSISYFLYMNFAVFVIITLAREFVHLLAPVLNGGAETMLRLMLSLVQYGCIIVSIFYALYLFGFQLGTVLTGASIMTIVIGLGANSLISDILAGLFIIFEREYQVGNYITVGDFTGIVREIGLRTTKVENSVGNVKIFNNSNIKEVLNLTDNLTTTIVSISISNEVPVKRIHELVNTRLREKTAYCREIIGAPFAEGIQEKPYGTNGYYCFAVAARSEQKDVTKVRNVLFTEFIELLKEENIAFL